VLNQARITKFTLYLHMIWKVALASLGAGGVFFVVAQIITAVVEDPLPWPRSIEVGIFLCFGLAGGIYKGNRRNYRRKRRRIYP